MLKGLPPIAAPDSRLLILGSMPGVASLQARRYYAHPRNSFWPIMGDLVGALPDLPYEARLEALLGAGVALWDVMAACERAGSLDANILPETVQPNDFLAFFAVHRQIRHICFNGGAAETCFRRRVLPGLPQPWPPMIRLPSTSPAFAAKRYREKLQEWREILRLLK